MNIKASFFSTLLIIFLIHNLFWDQREVLDANILSLSSQSNISREKV